MSQGGYPGGLGGDLGGEGGVQGGYPKYLIFWGWGGGGSIYHITRGRGGPNLPHFLGRGGRGGYRGGSYFTPFPGEGGEGGLFTTLPGGGGGTGGVPKNSRISRYGGGVSPVLRGGYLESHLSD